MATDGAAAGAGAASAREEGVGVGVRVLVLGKLVGVVRFAGEVEVCVCGCGLPAFCGGMVLSTCFGGDDDVVVGVCVCLLWPFV